MISKNSTIGGIHRPVITLKTRKEHDRKPIGLQRGRMLPLALVFILWAAPIVRAEPYQVLVIDVAGPHESGRIEEFKKDAAFLNSLHRRGYSAAKPYFNLLHMADGRVFFVFGFRDKVQGIHRRDYPGTVRNLRRLKREGVQKYPNMHWVPVEKIRKLLAAPKKGSNVHIQGNRRSENRQTGLVNKEHKFSRKAMRSVTNSDPEDQVFNVRIKP